MCLSDITQERVAAWTDHYVDNFVCENVARIMTLLQLYDV